MLHMLKKKPVQTLVRVLVVSIYKTQLIELLHQIYIKI